MLFYSGIEVDVGGLLTIMTIVFFWWSSAYYYYGHYNLYLKMFINQETQIITTVYNLVQLYYIIWYYSVLDIEEFDMPLNMESITFEEQIRISTEGNTDYSWTKRPAQLLLPPCKKCY